MAFSGKTVRKRFGQHWLVDSTVLERIVEAADLQHEDRVLEVGPGRGALTDRLLDSEASAVHAIEIDRGLVELLRKRFSGNSRFTLREGDVLSTSLILPDGREATKVVANIPYNITGPLLERLLGRLDKPAPFRFKRLVLLLQKEVAERIRAKPGQSCFSALSVRMQLMASCRRICGVSPRSFEPKPKVDSEVIALEPLASDELLDQGLASSVEILLKRAFISRRKMLRNTLKGLFSKDDLKVLAKEAGISLDQRPQEVSPVAWCVLARGLSSTNLVGKDR